MTRNALPIALFMWALIMLAYTVARAGNLYGIVYDSMAFQGAVVDVMRCHCATTKYPYPRPYATTTTDLWGMYEFCLPDDSYIVTPRPIEGREITPEFEIVTIKPCQ